MLERATENLDGRDVNMWVRKNRQGLAGDIKVEIEGNETFTSFRDKNDLTPPAPTDWQNDFDNNDDIPF